MLIWNNINYKRFHMTSGFIRCQGKKSKMFPVFIFIAFIVFALFGCIVVVLWSGASLLRDGRISIGEMTRFALYTAFVVVTLLTI